jgi:hypothetical protein
VVLVGIAVDRQHRHRAGGRTRTHLEGAGNGPDGGDFVG